MAKPRIVGYGGGNLRPASGVDSGRASSVPPYSCDRGINHPFVNYCPKHNPPGLVHLLLVCHYLYSSPTTLQSSNLLMGKSTALRGPKPRPAASRATRPVPSKLFRLSSRSPRNRLSNARIEDLLQVLLHTHAA